MGSVSKIIILNPGRVGGSLLMEALDSHSQLRITGEILNLNRPSIPDPCRDILEEIIGTIPHRRDKRANLSVPASYIDKLLEIYDGFKLLYYETNEHIIRYLQNREDLKMIHLIRWNKLERFVSKEIANRDKIYHLRKSNRRLQKKISIAPKTLRKYFKSKPEARYRSMFPDMLEIYYEDMVGNWEETTHMIQKFIGVVPEPLPITQQKVIQNPMQEVIENYGELYRCFRGSEHECYFKPPILHL